VRRAGKIALVDAYKDADELVLSARRWLETLPASRVAASG
jgi:hypothetical protein